MRVKVWDKQWIIGLLTLALVLSGGLVFGQAELKPLTKAERDMASQINNVFRRAVQQSMPSVVSLHVSKNVEGSGFGPSNHVEGLGSGVIIDGRGYIITNDHVVNNTDKVDVKLTDGREFTATDVFLDPATDLAVVQIDPGDDTLPVAQIGDSDEVEVGDFVLVIGSPFQLDQTVTAGIVSYKGRETGILRRQAGYEDFIQTDADINKGNSGGPLVNLYGEVIGINSNIFSPTGVSAGYGFSIPSNLVKFVADQLIGGGEVKRGFLGVRQLGLDEIRSYSEDMLRREPKLWKSTHGEGNLFSTLPEDMQGVLLFEVVRNEPAYKAGLKDGDIVLKINDVVVTSSKELRNYIATISPGANATCLVWRNGETFTADVTLTERTQERVHSRRPNSNRPLQGQAGKPKLGVGVRQLTAEVAADYGYPQNAQGVIIDYVQSGSLAEECGLKAGDIIVSINARPIVEVGQLQELIAYSDLDDEGVVLEIRDLSSKRTVVVKRGGE